LPASALAKAANYTLALWPKLTRFLEYPELELSNNLTENSVRPVALGRKNWIHIGSQQAGPKVAAILSVVETCRRMNIPVREYLAAVLPGLADTPMHRLAQLTLPPGPRTDSNLHSRCQPCLCSDAYRQCGCFAWSA
jgi:transposase